MANSAQSFKAPQCESDRNRWVRLLKKCAASYSHKSNLSLPPTSSKLAQNSSTSSSVVAIGLGEARRHELDKFRERVAVVETVFRSTLSKEKPFPACSLWRAQMTHSAQPLCAWFGGKRDGSCTLISN
jgi:hypothetical protein